MSLTVGVLLPTSRMFPGVDHGFLAGIHGALAGNPGVRLAVEFIGPAAHQPVVQEKVQKLLIVDRADIVVGILGAGLIQHVTSSFADHQTPLIVCNLGADPLPMGDSPNPFLFWHSLNIWQSAYALGYWAARHLGRSAAVAAGFHEAGFGLVNALSLGFEAAGGGRFSAVEVTHKTSAIEDPSDAVARLAASAPDLVFGCYAGREGPSFMGAYASLGLAGKVPLLTTPLMTHGHWLPQMGPEVLGVRTACSWAPGTHPAEEAQFAAACAGSVSRPAPDVFALLGYEAGLIVSGASARLGPGVHSGAALRDAMAGLTITSPRGRLPIDAQLQSTTTIDHLITIAPDATGAPGWKAKGRLDLPDRYAEDALLLHRQLMRPGWLNPYLVN